MPQKHYVSAADMEPLAGLRDKTAMKPFAGDRCRFDATALNRQGQYM